MNISSDAHKKLMAAYELLTGASLSVDSFEHIHTVIKGIHPELDKKLEVCAAALDGLQKIQSLDVISLTADALPEDTEEKRKASTCSIPHILYIAPERFFSRHRSDCRYRWIQLHSPFLPKMDPVRENHGQCEQPGGYEHHRVRSDGLEHPTRQ